MRKKDKFIYIISGFGIAILLSLIISLTFVITGVVQFDHKLPNWVWDLEDLLGSVKGNLPDWDLDSLPDDVKQELLDYLKKNLTSEDLDQGSFETLLGNSVIIATGDAKKPYDGTPLTCELYYVVNEKIVEDNNHTVQVSPYGQQTIVGSSDNVALIKIVDEFGNDVTQDYSIKTFYGTLTVTDGLTEEKDDKDLDALGAGKDDLDLADLLIGSVGALASGDLLSDSDMLGDDYPQGEVLRVRSDTDGYVYLRNTCFGDYNYKGKGFSEAVPYSRKGVNDVFNSTSDCLAIGTNRIAISVIAPYLNSYFLPYYATDKYDLTDDVAIYDYQDEYYVDFKNYDYITSDALLSAKDLGDYNDFVRANYLTIDSELKDELLDLTGNFTALGKDLVQNIVSYVRQAATYNLKFAPFPEDEDIILYFLKEAKEGICQHFAAAATMIFRAYGIPARYTIGFLAITEADSFIKVTSREAHAWVEIYLDDIGWVQVEVTGGGFSPTGGVDDGLMPPDFAGENAGGGTNIADSPIEKSDKEIADIVADRDGLYYLREKSFGDYNGKGFEDAAVYAYSFGGMDSVFNPTVYAISGEQGNIHVKILDDGIEDMLLTYYPTGEYHLENDATVKTDLKEYDVPFISYDYFYNIAPTGGLDISAYNGFVRNTYLTIDPELKAALLELTAFDAGTSSQEKLIKDIAKFVRQSATYNMDFAPFPEDEDIILYFLKESKEGICQHFAAAATMIYRAYGIPARYTVGYVVAAHENEGVIIGADAAHAWVEIYIENIGWVQMEVTNSDGVPEYRRTIKVLNGGNSKVYDGTPLEVSLDNLKIDDSQLKDGHIIVWDNDDLPSITNVSESGTVLNAPKFKIIDTALDEENNDVTDQYVWDYSDCQTLEIERCPVTVTAVGNRIYDGTATVSADTVYAVEYEVWREDGEDGLFGDDELELSFGDLEGKNGTDGTDFGSYCYGDVDDAGKFNIFARVTDNGEDVTDNYDITISANSVYTVNKKYVSLSTGSYTWFYDGEWHHCEDLFIDSLAQTDVAEVLNRTTIKEGEAINVLDIGIYREGSHEDKSYNYEITDYDWGTLKAENNVYVSSDDQEYMYDGKVHDGEYSAKWFDGENFVDIPDRFTVEFAKQSLKDVGKVDNIPSEVTIRNKQGKNLTANYLFDYSGCNDKVLEVYKRPITVTTDSDSKPFDKTALKKETLTVGLYGLADGDSIEATFTGSQTEIGTSKNTVLSGKDGILIYNSDYDIVNDNYDLMSFTEGTLEVTKRRLVVSSDSAEKLYDGNALVGSGYAFDGDGLLSGDEATYTEKSITDAGSADNRPQNIVIKENFGYGADVTASRYEITYSGCGTLTVNKRTLTVSSDSAEKIYDVEVLDGSGYAFGGDGLLSGDKATYTKTSITDAGTADNLPQDIVIKNNFGSGADVTANYELDYSGCGTLKINKRKIYVTSSGDVVFDYNDGEEHKSPLSAYGVAAADKTSGFIGTDHVISVVPAEITEVGTVSNRPKEVTITNAENYELDYSQCYGTLTLNGVTLYVSNKAASYFYDGKTHYGEYIFDGLVDGDYIDETCYTPSSLKDVGTIYPHQPIGTIKVKDDAGNEVSGKYKFDYSGCVNSLEVTKRDVEIKISGEKVYDGVASMNDNNSSLDYEVYIDGELSALYNGESVSCTVTLNSADVGNRSVIEVNFPYSLTKNYNITAISGGFTITPREISVETLYCKKTYNGEEQFGYGITATTLPSGHSISATFVKDGRIDVGEYVNEIAENSVVIKDSYANDVTANYIITGYTFGTFKIMKRTVSVAVTNSVSEKQFDGTPLEGAYSFTGLVTGHIATYYPAAITEPGVIDNFPTELKVGYGGTDVSDNYEFDLKGCKGLKLRITKIVITVTSGDTEKVYDGTSLIGTCFATANPLEAKGYNMTLTQKSVLYVGWAENKADVKVFKDGADVTAKYYEIVYGACGKITVSQRQITVTSGSAKKVYDGTELKNDTYIVGGDGLADGQAIEVQFPDEGQKEVGYTENVITIRKVTDANNKDVTKNYKITIIYGTLIVDPPAGS